MTPGLSACVLQSASDNKLAGQFGVKLGGTKYMLIAGEPGSIVRGKKGQEDGVTVKKTMTALVIGIYSKGVQPADCDVIVENMGDCLAGQNI